LKKKKKKNWRGQTEGKGGLYQRVAMICYGRNIGYGSSVGCGCGRGFGDGAK
jgi:hypothetical protein